MKLYKFIFNKTHFLSHLEWVSHISFSKYINIDLEVKETVIENDDFYDDKYHLIFGYTIAPSFAEAEQQVNEFFEVEKNEI